jgi:rSAM/selenodomain-associated transferase 2
VALVSVIIPVLDDVQCLARTLEALGEDARVEIIVVNGGARTPPFIELERATPHVRWAASPAGRGRQMNVGAKMARGDWLLFLHADTRLAAGWIEELEHVRQLPHVVGGSFRFTLDSARRRARVLERGVYARVRWLNLPYGDQGLFVRRDVFVSLGGYRELPLMEDVDFVRRLRKTGRLHHSRLPAVTSARRWERDGWIRRSAENVILVLLFLAGASPDRLAARYKRGAAPHNRGHRVSVARDE